VQTRRRRITAEVELVPGRRSSSPRHYQVDALNIAAELELARRGLARELGGARRRRASPWRLQPAQ